MFNTVSEADFKSAMKNLAAGVTLITSVSNAQRGGMTATAVCSLSAAPAQLVVCVNRQNTTHQMIVESRKFCVNVLTADQSEVAQRFANPLARAERFGCDRWSVLKTGAPVLMDALVAFDCELGEAIESGTHSIFIGRVVDVHALEQNSPLLYYRSGYAGITAHA
ncbi:flavin reductase family protein [Burkholderia sp. Ac-20353]|uniref:flavin reductase family protein n=1 Tax=Burkholderia sp. Ac-20353 TaxID=2703894 RepID=UPI00197B2D73|nr:flavin reductase family protein [Burkholderia sp. Ac-20353]MBN3789754.1 flavin reductase family protein [Burkholderia sp. Ac-20353]